MKARGRPVAYPADSPAGRLLAGDREAVAEVVRWISRVLASPRFWSLRRDWADLTQDVMGRLLESLERGRYDASRDFRVYVQGITRFAAFDAVSRRRPEVQVEDDMGFDDAIADDTIEGRLNSMQMARQVLQRASDTCRELLTAYFLEQKSHVEIAEEMGQPIGTIKSRLFRCLDAARVAFGGRGAARE